MYTCALYKVYQLLVVYLQLDGIINFWNSLYLLLSRRYCLVIFVWIIPNSSYSVISIFIFNCSDIFFLFNTLLTTCITCMCIWNILCFWKKNHAKHVIFQPRHFYLCPEDQRHSAQYNLFQKAFHCLSSKSRPKKICGIHCCSKEKK